MKCGNCGQVLESESVFCPRCGSYIFTSAKKPPKHGNRDDFSSYSYKKEDATIQNKVSDDNVTKDEISKDRVLKDKILHEEIVDEISATTSEVYEEEDMEELKRGRGIKTFFLGLFIAALLIGSATFAGYYAYSHFMGNSTSEYTSSINKLSTDIINANDEMAAIIKKSGDELPAKEILDQAYTVYDKFNKIKNAYNKIIAPSTYSDSHQKLGEAIELNKSIYKQLELILKNPVHPDTSKNMDQLSNDITGCMNNFSQIKINGVNISLPDEILTISSKLQPYIKKKQAEYSQVTSLIATFSKYFDDMAKLFVSYDSAAADFNQILNSVRIGQESWDKLFSQLDDSEIIVKNVKADYEKLKVPSELKAINKRFGPILDDQLSYYAKLRLAARIERDSEAAANTGASEDIKIDDTAPPPVDSTEPGGNTSQGADPKTSVFVPKETGEKPGETLEEEVDIHLLYMEAQTLSTSISENYQKFALDLKAEKDKYLDPEFVLKLKSGK